MTPNDEPSSFSYYIMMALCVAALVLWVAHDVLTLFSGHLPAWWSW